jgi:hypothetical protein
MYTMMKQLKNVSFNIYHTILIGFFIKILYLKYRQMFFRQYRFFYIILHNVYML